MKKQYYFSLQEHDNKKSNDINFKVYNDYLIQDPSEYGEKDN